MTLFLANAATQTGLTAMAATNMVTSNLVTSTLLTSSPQTNISLTTNHVDTYSPPSNTKTRVKALAAAAGTTTALVPISAAAQVEDTPPVLEIYGEKASKGIGDVPITELPTHEDHTPYIIGALITYVAPLLRLTLGVARLFVPALKTTTEEAASSTSSIQKANRVIGRIAASPWGTGLAHLRNIGGLIYLVDSIKNDTLRVWSCYTPEFIILVGTLTSFIIRGLVYRSLNKLKKMGKLTNTDRQMHRINALGFLPHRIPEPVQTQASKETDTEAEADMETKT